MIDTILNLVFRCAHRHLTRPVTPVNKKGEPRGDTYVVCLDCAKQFAYDLQEMKIGNPIKRPEGVLPPEHPKPRRSKLKYALWAVPIGIVVAALVQPKRNTAKPGEPKR